MSIASSCRRVSVTEQFPYDWQPKPGTGTKTGMGMSQVMETYASESRTLGHSPPGAVEVSPCCFLVGAGGLAGDDVGTQPRQVGQHLHSRSVEHDRLLAGLAVREEQESSLKVHPLPS